MKKLIFCFPFLLLFWQCTLGAKQEAALNKALSNYITARNDCQVTGLVGFSYPDYVAHYHNLGDTVFKQKFDCDESAEYFYAIKNASLRETVTQGDMIQILYEFDSWGSKMDEREDTKFKLVAISSNKGDNWYFIPYRDYENDSICTALNKLLLDD